MTIGIMRAGALLASIAIAGCATTGAADRTALLGGEWRVAEVGTSAVIADSRASLGFSEDGRLYGNASCNRLVGTYRVEGAQLTISNSGLTMMACPSAEMDQERRFVDILNQVSSYEIDATGALVLRTPSGAKIVARR